MSEDPDRAHWMFAVAQMIHSICEVLAYTSLFTLLLFLARGCWGRQWDLPL